MYAKLFESIYDGTLVEDWRALITFQQMIILCDSDGVIDMTPEAMCRRTGIPLKYITAGIEILEAEDPRSRSADDGGRRIVRLDDHRSWGWKIVNYFKYRHTTDYETIKEQNRERQRKYREKHKSLNGNGSNVTVTESNGESRHTEEEEEERSPLTPQGGRDHGFARFWETWPSSPRKVAKAKCLEKWQRSGLNRIADQIIAHVEAMKECEQWKKKGFEPAPLTYLGQKRWQDGEPSLANNGGEKNPWLP